MFNFKDTQFSGGIQPIGSPLLFLISRFFFTPGRVAGPTALLAGGFLVDNFAFRAKIALGVQGSCLLPDLLTE
jgi:hypothetical protein